MVTYIATVWAKPGHENDVTRFYQDLEPLMREAKGFRSRRIMRGRIAFSRGAAAGRSKLLFPHILPEHSHEFYEDVTPD